MFTCFVWFVESVMVVLARPQTKHWPLMVSSFLLMVSVCLFFVLDMNLHSAYLWLATVLVIIILLASFTCTFSLPRLLIPMDPVNLETHPSSNQNENGDPPDFWVVVDPPPKYETIVNCDPPSYSKVTGALSLTDARVSRQSPGRVDQVLPDVSLASTMENQSARRSAESTSDIFVVPISCNDTLTSSLSANSYVAEPPDYSTIFNKQSFYQEVTSS